MESQAKESAHIERAREKILRQFRAIDKKINQDSIAAMSLLIKQRFAKQQQELKNLKKRQVTDFSKPKKKGKEGEQVKQNSHVEGRIKTIFSKKK